MKPVINKSIRATCLVIVAAAHSANAWAHHSFAMFDNSKSVDLRGTVKELQWTNPHIWIQLLVNESGHEVEYSIEGASPNGLMRKGWTRQLIKPGDRITITIHPLKEGAAGGSFVKAVLPDGRVLSESNQ